MRNVSEEAEFRFVDFLFLLPVHFLNHVVLLAAIPLNELINQQDAERSEQDEINSVSPVTQIPGRSDVDEQGLRLAFLSVNVILVFH